MVKKFNEDFKQTIIDLHNSGKGVTELSREYGISIPTIYTWINHSKGIHHNNQDADPEDIELLKHEILRLKEENEILKKATAIFAKRN